MVPWARVVGNCCPIAAPRGIARRSGGDAGAKDAATTVNPDSAPDAADAAAENTGSVDGRDAATDVFREAGGAQDGNDGATDAPELRAGDGTPCTMADQCAGGACVGSGCASLRVIPRWYAANNTEADDVWSTLVYRLGALTSIPSGWTHVQRFDVTAQPAMVELGSPAPLDGSPVCSAQGTVSPEQHIAFGHVEPWVFTRVIGGDANRPTFTLFYTDQSGNGSQLDGVAFVEFYIQHPASANPDYKVVWVIYPDGAMRLNHLRDVPTVDPTQQFSSSHWLGFSSSLPDQLDGSGCLTSNNKIAISSIAVAHGADGRPLVTLSGVALESGKATFTLSWALSVDPPIVGMTRVHVTQTALAAADVTLQKLEGTSVLFGPQMSSMYKSASSFDADLLVHGEGEQLGIGTLHTSPSSSNTTLPWPVGTPVRLDKDAMTTHNVDGPAVSLVPM
jgi:hypothetical protein